MGKGEREGLVVNTRTLPPLPPIPMEVLLLIHIYFSSFSTTLSFSDLLMASFTESDIYFGYAERSYNVSHQQ